MANITTALFDIKRETNGDGRSMDEYLKWFDTTLSIESPMTIYTEPKFYEFVKSGRSGKESNIICYELEDIPYYHLLSKMDLILSDKEYIGRIKDPSRIECRLSMYNIIQYSKFKWITNSIALDNGKSDFYFWMDAGCSRFFNNGNLKNWPNSEKLERGKLNIQGNTNTQLMYPILEPDVYKWDNNCILVGTLFGGDPETMLAVDYEVSNILNNEMISQGMINNEQIALGMLYKRRPDLFSVHINTYSGHLPFFEYLSIR
jgi:hypothetical protein